MDDMVDDIGLQAAEALVAEYIAQYRQRVARHGRASRAEQIDIRFKCAHPALESWDGVRRKAAWVNVTVYPPTISPPLGCSTWPVR